MTRFVPAAIGFALMVAFVPDWGGLATTPRWDVFVLMAAALFFGGLNNVHADRYLHSMDASTLPRGNGGGDQGRDRGPASRALLVGLAMAAWLLLSVAWSSSPLDGIDAAGKLLLVGVAFAWAAALVDLVPFIAGAAAGLAVSSLLAVAQWYGWHPVEQYGEPSGLFYSGNRMAEAALLVFAAALGLRLWWALPGLLPALLLPHERAVWMAAAIVVAVWGWQRADGFSRFVLACIAAQAVLLLAMTATIWRTSNFGFEGIAERLAMWQFSVAHLSTFGHGLGSFVNDGPLLAWPVSPGSRFDLVTRAEHPHNEWLWLAYEGGVGAVALCGALAVLLWRAGGDPLRLVLVGLFILSCLAMPFHDPATIGVAAVCAGCSVGARRRVLLADDGSRDPLRAWVEGGRGTGEERRGAAAGGAAVSVSETVS